MKGQIMSPSDVPSYRPGQPADGLAVWDAEAAGLTPGATLPLVRLDASERLLIPFTVAMVRVAVHYLDSPALRGYVRCPGADCLLCQVGRQADVRDLLPVYDPVERAVAVLPISTNLRAAALRPQIAPVLRRLRHDHGRPPLIALRRLDAGKFALATLDLPEGVDDGAAAVKSFRDRLEAGEIDLASAYPQLTRQDLAAIPEVAAAMRVRGVAP
jgi:hypothetical protein